MLNPHVGVVAEQECDRERPVQLRQYRRDGILRSSAAIDFAGHQVADDLGIRLAFKFAPFGDQFVAKRLEVLDDAIVHQSDRPDDVRMCIAHGGRAMVDATDEIIEKADEITDVIEERLPGGVVVNRAFDFVLMPGRFGVRVVRSVLSVERPPE